MIRIILAWYAPEWEGNGLPGTGGERIWTYAPEGETLSTTGKRFTHMYTTRFANAGEVATYLGRNHKQLLRRIIAWQSAIYEDPRCPDGWRTRSSTLSITSLHAACGRRPKIPLEAGAGRRTGSSLWKKPRAPART